MDKYEFNLKIEQMKKLINEEDYVTALKIVQSIDWHRVRNTNLLTMAATVYEKTDMLPEAKDMYVLAFERAPIGKHLLFKLTELSCRTGDQAEAEEYYREYRAVDATDIGNYLLQYMILKARHAPYEKQLLPLERYCEIDPDEKWMYELATSYEYANRLADCVRTCDKIALLYGDSTYSLKALRLKSRYTELTDVQRNLLTPRTVPEEKIRYEEPVYDEDTFAKNEEPAEAAESRPVSISDILAGKEDASEKAEFGERGYRYSVADDPVIEEKPEETEEEIAERNADMFRKSDALAAARYEDEDAAFAAYVKAHASADVSEETAAEEPAAEEAVPDGDGVQMAFDFGGGEPVVVNDPEEAPTEVSDNTEAVPDEIAAAPEETVSAPAPAVIPVPEVVPAVPAEPVREAVPAVEVKPAAPAAEKAAAPAAKAVPAMTFHMIIEAETLAEGLNIAIDELKNVHEDNGIEHSAIKTSADKLNLKGITPAILDKVRGKDFVIEHAGSLDADNINTLYNFIKTDKSGTIVVLIDTPEGLDNIEDTRPELFDICDYISDIDEEEEIEEIEDLDEELDDEDIVEEDDEDEEDDEEAYEDDDSDDEPYEDEDDVEEEEVREPVKRSNGKVTAERFFNMKEVTPSRPDHQMEIDEFAQYCAQYAAEIDCSITGTSLLALYERIELMEEDGIPLTKTNAEQLIEEAADRAEKPPIGKRITGMFRSKYDKNGLLILKEDDFIY